MACLIQNAEKKHLAPTCFVSLSGESCHKSLTCDQLDGDHNPIVMTIAGQDIPWREYFYYLYRQCQSVEQYFDTMTMYGMAATWSDAADEDGHSYADLAVESARNIALSLSSTLGFAESNDVSLSVADLETIEKKVQEDILAEDSVYYKVVLQGEERIIGGICVWKTGERVRFIAPVFIDPVEQRKHCGTEVLRQILEGPDPFGTAQENPGEKEQALTWKLTCTLENGPLMHFYENMGFRESGERALVNEKTTLALLQQEKVLDQAGQIGNNRYMPGRSCGG